MSTFLLQKAFLEFQSLYPGWNIEIVEEIADARGKYAYRVFSKAYGVYRFFAAKGSMGGDKVSVHLQLFWKAYLSKEGIIIAVAAKDKTRFYSYKPEDILAENNVNERDGALMINFSIKAGRSLQKHVSKTSEPEHPVLSKLQTELGAEFISSE